LLHVSENVINVINENVTNVTNVINVINENVINVINVKFVSGFAVLQASRLQPRTAVEVSPHKVSALPFYKYGRN
jgi:hypothetical protein